MFNLQDTIQSESNLKNNSFIQKRLMCMCCRMCGACLVKGKSVFM